MTNALTDIVGAPGRPAVIQVSAERTIDARPADVYRVLSDYRTHRPRLLPAPLFSDLAIARGGVGEGTVFYVTRAGRGGSERLRLRVSEPEPGWVLTERDIDTGETTVFSVAPAGDRSATHVRISSHSVPGTGVRGAFDRVLRPMVTGRLLARQLGELDRYMGTLGQR